MYWTTCQAVPGKGSHARLPRTPRRSGAILNRSHLAADLAQVTKIIEPSWINAPVAVISEPAETEIQPGCQQAARKRIRNTRGPALGYIRRGTTAHGGGRPVFGQTGQVNFAGGDHRGFPIHRKHTALVLKHVVRIILNMDDA